MIIKILGSGCKKCVALGENARAAAAAIPGATLVSFEDLGHSPQVQDPARFNAALLKAISQHD